MRLISLCHIIGLGDLTNISAIGGIDRRLVFGVIFGAIFAILFC